MTTTTEDIVAAIHARATNDRNGNPRRCFVGTDRHGHVLIVTDEGYEGRPDWVRALNSRGVWELQLTVPPAEYRRLIGWGARLPTLPAADPSRDRWGRDLTDPHYGVPTVGADR